MVLPTGHMWVVIGGPDGQFGARRGELEIDTDFGPPGGPLKGPEKPLGGLNPTILLWRQPLGGPR